MAPIVSAFRRLELREREDDCGSDCSTIKGIPLNRSCSSDSVNTYVNSAARIENEDSDSSSESSYEESPPERHTTTRIKQIDLSPEAVKKRKEVYNNWLESVKSREKQKKRLEQEQREAELEAQRELIEERKAQAEAKVQAWMVKKRVEAEKKMARISEMKKKIVVDNSKTKDFKRAINFQDWISQKNESLINEKKRQEEKQSVTKNYQKFRETASSKSYDNWVRKAPSKPKPVPIGKGLDSLRGSTTKIFVNPEPWNEDWD